MRDTKPVYATGASHWFDGWTGEVEVVPVGAIGADVRIVTRQEPDEEPSHITVAWLPQREFADAVARLLRAVWGARASFPRED